MSVANEPVGKLAEDKSGLDEFFSTLRGSNPFTSTRVNSPDQAVATVSEIHANEFRKLCELSDEIGDGEQSAGVLLTGGAGVGKSHLLSRLCTWAKQEKRAFYLYLHNVMASPERMPRHFLRSVISQLVSGRESYKDSPLYLLIMGVLQELRKSGRLSVTDKKVNSEEARESLRVLVNRLKLRDDPINRAVVEVLFKYFAVINVNADISGANDDYVTAILDWLSGDGIDVEMAEKIGIPKNQQQADADGMIRLADNQQIEQVLMILGALSQVCKRTLLICLDQFDNLAPDQVQEISRFLHALLGNGRNILVVISGVSETMERFIANDVITQAQQAVLARHEVRLHYITPVQADAILRERLAPIHKQFLHVPILTQKFQEHALFPVGDKEFQLRFGEMIDIRPRAVVTWADEVWRKEKERLRELGGEAWLKNWDKTKPITSEVTLKLEDVIDDAVKKALNENIADRRNQPGSLPADADNLATVVQRILSYCQQKSNYSLVDLQRMPKDKPCHLLVRETAQGSGQVVRSGVTFVTSRDGRSAKNPVLRLADAEELEHKILVTDQERAPLPTPPTVVKAIEKMTNNGASGFKHVHLNFQLCVQLDSIRSVIEDAANIAIEYPQGQNRGLTPEEVAASLDRQNLIVAHPLLHELLTEPGHGHTSPPPIIPEPLIRTVIFGNLGFKICVMSNDVVTDVINQMDDQAPAFETVHDAVLNYVRKLEQADELFVREHVHGLLIMHPKRSAKS